MVPVTEQEFRSPDVVVGEREEVNVEKRNNSNGPGPVVFVEVEDCVFPAGMFQYGRERWDADSEGGFVVEDKNGAEGMTFVFDGEDFVFGIDRPDNVCGVDDDEFGGWAWLVLVAGGWRRVGAGDPVCQRESNVKVIGEHGVGEFCERAVNMGLATVIVMFDHIGKAFEFKCDGNGLVGDGDGSLDGEVFFAAFGDEGVSTRLEINTEGMGGKGGVDFDAVPASLPGVPDGGTFRRGGVDVKVFAFGIGEIKTGR